MASQANGPATAYSIVGRQIVNKFAALDTVQIPVGFQGYIPQSFRPVVVVPKPDMPGYDINLATVAPSVTNQLLSQLYSPPVKATK